MIWIIIILFSLGGICFSQQEKIDIYRNIKLKVMEDRNNFLLTEVNIECYFFSTYDPVLEDSLLDGEFLIYSFSNQFEYINTSECNDNHVSVFPFQDSDCTMTFAYSDRYKKIYVLFGLDENDIVDFLIDFSAIYKIKTGRSDFFTLSKSSFLNLCHEENDILYAFLILKKIIRKKDVRNIDFSYLQKKFKSINKRVNSCSIVQHEFFFDH